MAPLPEKRRLAAEDLLDLALPGDVNLSPDGSLVAYTLQTIDKEKNEYRSRIYVVAPGQAPRQYTGGEKDSTPRWSPDGTRLAFVSNRSGSNQLWVLHRQGGEAHQLTKIKGDCSNPVWSPDGRYLAFVAKLPPEGIKPEAKDEEEKDLFKKFNKDVKVITRLWYKLDGVGYFDEKRSHICVIPVSPEGTPAGEPRQLTSGDFDHKDPAWSPDGRYLAFVANRRPDADWHPATADLHIIPVEGGEIRTLTSSNLAAAAPAWSPDGRTIAFIANDPEESGYDNPEIYLVLVEGGQPRCLTYHLDRAWANEAISDLLGPAGAALTWSPDGQSLYYFASEAGRVNLYRIDVASGEAQPLTTGEQMVYSFSFNRDRSRVALAITSFTEPGDIYLAQPGPAGHTAPWTLERLTEVNGQFLRAVELSQPEKFNFRAGPEEPLVDGWVMRPAGFIPGKKYPTILEIHGGPMGMYGVGMFFEFQWLAANGYAVVFTNPRGSLGYGRDFCRAIRGQWGDKDYRDVMAGIEEAVRRYDFIDGDKLGVAGGSYGGFMTNWILGHTDRFRAAVTMRSVVNRHSAMGTSDMGFNRMKQYGNVPWWEDPTPYWQQSPLAHAGKITTPVLIEHQEGDLRVPIEQGEQLFAVLKFLNRPVKFVRYPGEFHGMSRNGKPWHRVYRLKVNLEWFDQYLK